MAEYLVECNKCNNCQTCDVGNQSTCSNHKCQIFSNRFGSFSFGACPISGNSMCPDSNQFNVDDWNKIYDHLNKRTSLKGVDEYKTWVNSLGLVSPFSAKEFNNIASKISGAPTVSSGGLIKGEYFTNLANALNNLSIKATACDTDCNVECETCDNRRQSINNSYCCNGDCESVCQTGDSCPGCQYTCEASHDTH